VSASPVEPETDRRRAAAPAFHIHIWNPLMKTRERLVIYSLLAVLVCVNLVHLLPKADRPAFAEPVFATELGPADSLILSGSDGAEPLVLRNAEGRLAWSDKPQDRLHSVAYVYIGKILSSLMQSERYTEVRDQLLEELQATEQEYRERLDEIRGRLQEMERDSPEAQAVFEEGQTAFREYQQWQQEALARRGKLDAEQLEQAYREMIDAVEVVADRMDVDTVYRFIPTSEPFEAENPEQAMLAIRMRTALRYPDRLDITSAVIEEMSLEVIE
jgi:Skp family chaperone for outer membrane proteins